MIELIGIAGIIFLLAAFVSIQTKKLKPESYPYDALNLIGAVLLAIYAYLISSWVFVALQLIWAFAAVVFIVRRLIKR